MLQMLLHKTTAFKRIFLFLVTVLFPLINYAQYTISGSVRDIENKPLISATVVVFFEDNDNPEAFAITNNKGFYSIEVNQIGNYRVKVSFLGYKTAERFVAISKDIPDINSFIKLEESTSELEEVILEAEKLDAQVKEDTIIYNIDKFISGTEANLKDILQKLPGIDIDDQGKIKAYGKKIDKLLIDGEEFFDDMHQLATENIAAEMVKNVELYDNYQEFESIKSFEDTNKKALNVNIKDRFKGRITGNASLEGGYNERYAGHLNLFQFSRKLKFTSISDYNNLGNQALTFDDYVAMQGGMQEYVKNNGVNGMLITTDKDLPAFLRESSDVQKREAYFSVLNFIWKPLKKLKVEGLSILDFAQIEKVEEIKQRYFNTNEEVSILDNRQTIGDIFAGNIKLEADYKTGDNSILSYTLRYNRQTDNEEQEGLNSTNDSIFSFNQDLENRTKNFGQQLSYIQGLSNNILLTVNTFHDRRERIQPLSISSNAALLNLAPEIFSIEQLKKENDQQLGFASKANIKLKNDRMVVGFGGNFSKQELLSQTSPGLLDFTNNTDISRNDYYITSSYTIKRKIMRYNFKLDYHFYSFESTVLNDRFQRLFPSLGITAKFKKTSIGSFNYRYGNQFSSVSELPNESIIDDFRTLYKNEDVGFNSIIPSHNFSMNYFLFDLFSGTTFTMVLNHTLRKDYIAQDVITTGATTSLTYRIAPQIQSTSAFLVWDKKLKKLPFSLSYKLVLNTDQGDTFINSLPVESRSALVSNQFILRSRFLEEVFNFELGVRNVYNETKINTLGNSGFLRLWEGSFSLNGKFDNGLIWNFNTKVINYESNGTTINITNLSPSIRYRKTKSKWEFSLTGSDLLNINALQRVSINNQPNFFEERVISALPGYAVFGLKYYF
jgi:hypothetical protein